MVFQALYLALEHLNLLLERLLLGVGFASRVLELLLQFLYPLLELLALSALVLQVLLKLALRALELRL